MIQKKMVNQKRMIAHLCIIRSLAGSFICTRPFSCNQPPTTEQSIITAIITKQKGRVSFRVPGERFSRDGSRAYSCCGQLSKQIPLIVLASPEGFASMSLNKKSSGLLWTFKLPGFKFHSLTRSSDIHEDVARGVSFAFVLLPCCGGGRRHLAEKLLERSFYQVCHQLINIIVPSSPSSFAYWPPEYHHKTINQEKIWETFKAIHHRNAKNET